MIPMLAPILGVVFGLDWLTLNSYLVLSVAHHDIFISAERHKSSCLFHQWCFCNQGLALRFQAKAPKTSLINISGQKQDS